MKNIKRNSIIILILTIGILIYILKDDYQIILNTILNANILLIILAMMIYLIHFLFDQLSILNVARQYKKETTFKYIIHLGIFTKFFNGITPLASGGQPMQVYELHKKGFSINHGTNIIIQNFIIYQLALVLIGVISLICNHAMHLFQEVPLLKELTIIGFILNILILLLLLLVSFSKNFNKRIINFIIKVLSIFNKKLDKDKKVKKWNTYCDNYYESAKILLKNKKIFFKCFIYQSLSLLTYYMIPLPLIYALGISSNINLITTIVASSYVFIMGCYVPIPGATGGMEYGFFGFFGNFITGSSLTSLVILWRFITYYVPTIIGGIVFSTSPLKKVTSKDLEEINEA